MWSIALAIGKNLSKPRVFVYTFCGNFRTRMSWYNSGIVLVYCIILLYIVLFVLTNYFQDGNNGKDGIDMDYCKCPERVSITEALKYQREHFLPSLPFSQSTNIGSAAPSSGREVPASLLVGEGTSKDYSNEIVNEEEEPTIIINKAKLRSGQVRIKKQKVQKS